MQYCSVVMGLLFATEFQILNTLRKKLFENIVGKGKNACNEHFFLNVFVLKHRKN